MLIRTLWVVLVIVTAPWIETTALPLESRTASWSVPEKTSRPVPVPAGRFRVTLMFWPGLVGSGTLMGWFTVLPVLLS